MIIKCNFCRKDFEKEAAENARVRCKNCGRYGTVLHMQPGGNLGYDATLLVEARKSELKKFRSLAIVEINSMGVDQRDSLDRFRLPFKGSKRFVEREDVKILYVFSPKELEKCVPPQRSKT